MLARHAARGGRVRVRSHRSCVPGLLRGSQRHAGLPPRARAANEGTRLGDVFRRSRHWHIPVRPHTAPSPAVHRRGDMRLLHASVRSGRPRCVVGMGCDDRRGSVCKPRCLRPRQRQAPEGRHAGARHHGAGRAHAAGGRAMHGSRRTRALHERHHEVVSVGAGAALRPGRPEWNRAQPEGARATRRRRRRRACRGASRAGGAGQDLPVPVWLAQAARAALPLDRRPRHHRTGTRLRPARTGCRRS